MIEQTWTDELIREVYERSAQAALSVERMIGGLQDDPGVKIVDLNDAVEIACRIRDDLLRRLEVKNRHIELVDSQMRYQQNMVGKYATEMVQATWQISQLKLQLAHMTERAELFETHSKETRQAAYEAIDRYHRKLEARPSLGLLEHDIIESMVNDWLQRFGPGDNEWADAQTIRSWLDDYKGTFYKEKMNE